MNTLITILGPTATGKTSLAAALAARIGGEVISADSRQVYRGMDLGTGKDLGDYVVGSTTIPGHLIDIAEPGEEYNVFRFQQDFVNAFNEIIDRGNQPIMCGGTGMYLESVILNYSMSEAPPNASLREQLAKLSDEALKERVTASTSLHNITDTENRDRMIRAIEVAESAQPAPQINLDLKNIDHQVFGISLPRPQLRQNITDRLRQRLDEGMLDEVDQLLASGLSTEQLEFYGLEYKYLTQHISGRINYNDMFQRLNTAIHQFAKRQMTWFRRMEKRGVEINWIDGELSIQEKVNRIISINEDHHSRIKK